MKVFNIARRIINIFCNKSKNYSYNCRMKRLSVFRTMSIFSIFWLSSGMIAHTNTYPIEVMPYYELDLLYENVWGSIYNADTSQCDSTPTQTATGHRINPYKASEQRWIAISQEMLDNNYRASLVKNPKSQLFKGKIEYGDTVWIESPHNSINGWWVVRDAKNAKLRKSIDFLQTVGDNTLYNNDPQWSGKFDGISIYKLKNCSYNKFVKI